MSIRNLISEHVILPISDCLTGQHVSKYLKFLLESSQWSDEDILAFQNDQFKKMVVHISQNVPFYRDFFEREGLTLDDFQSLDDIVKLPIVSKSLMREEGIDRFSACNMPDSERMFQRSSGSTGEPFSYWISKEAYSFNLAAKLRTWYLNGYRLGDKYIKIGVGKGRTTFIKKIQDKANRCELIPYFALKEDDLDKILGRIEAYQPLFIRSYPSPLYALALRKISQINRFSYCPKAVFTTGSTLPESYRKVIEEAFGCKVIDSYSCEGCPNVAQEMGPFYHISREYGLIEVLNDDGVIMRNGVGRSVVTDFWNYAHPFIRYDTQDLVEISNADNSMSLFPVTITKIMGRECQSFRTRSGRLLTEHEFTTIKHAKIVDAYQIVKKREGSVKIRLVPNTQWSKEVGMDFQKYWEEQFEMPIEIEIVSEIPLMHNNKRLSIVEES